MLIPALLTLAAAPALPQAASRPGRAPAPIQQGVPTQTRSNRRSRPPLPQRGVFGEDLPEGDNVEEILGGRLTTGWGPFASASATPRRAIFQLRFEDPGTGWQESILLGIPPSPLPSPPLLVMFHGYGVSEWDCYYNTSIMKDAMRRGWYVVAPLGAHQLNYGITYSQQNVEFVLDWMLSWSGVDPSRIYGIGFSMGGGGMASYAARHLDPDHARFAAMVNHTGSVSLSHLHSTVLNPAVLEDPQMFGGPPSQFPFEYAQCSMFDLDDLTLTIDPNTDMARNVVNIPVLDVVASNEPPATMNLRTQTLSMHNWMGILGGIETLLQPIASQHSWLTLDPTVALDFLEQHTLSVPVTGTHKVLADRDGGWHHFVVYQTTAGAFTPFRWTMLPSLNRIAIDKTQNLHRIAVDSAALGLDTTRTVQVMFGTSDGTSEVITLTDYPQPPTAVRRAAAPTTNYWWDAQSETLTLYEYSAANYPLWTITP